jgi:hypothetical protein
VLESAVEAFSFLLDRGEDLVDVLAAFELPNSAAVAFLFMRIFSQRFNDTAVVRCWLYSRFDS